ncbi:RNA-directed DNA polymerase (plasmid) [Calothrix sp. NIES-4101]|nr:RNA-directed DNA polymerase [Calothrix sp. NIES-4101]
MALALKRVESNKGAAGVDGMQAAELRSWYTQHKEELLEEIREGTYEPLAVKRVEIPKADGKGMRELGIPTVIDRLVQQALLQVLTPLFDPEFSESSYGFRPRRRAHQAIDKAREYIREGYKWVVDIDLENFFNRVHQDKLMSKIAKRIEDKTVLKLIRSYLRVGIMVNGVCMYRDEGVPQGSPLSPLLSNIMLDELDKELEARGHRFCRYADDCNIYVKTARAGERVYEHTVRIIERRLLLKVNAEKSAVDRASRRKFLGFSFTSQREARVRLAPQTVKRFKGRVRKLTSRTWGVSMERRIESLNRYLHGWCAYFGKAETASIFKELQSWMHRRLRQCYLTQWKSGKTRYRNLVRLGLGSKFAAQLAASRKGTWRLALTPQLHKALDAAFWKASKVVDIVEKVFA